jgi:hypothetical protein
VEMLFRAKALQCDGVALLVMVVFCRSKIKIKAINPYARVRCARAGRFKLRIPRLSSNNIAQNGLPFGCDRSVTGVTWSGQARFGVWPCPVVCWCGAEEVRRMTSRQPPRSPMTESRSKSKPAARKHARKNAKSRLHSRSFPASRNSATRSDTKRARIIAMLRTAGGATIAAMMTATDWQQHSVRGFLAGVVRRKLGLNLVSEPTDDGRIYRIRDGKASAAGNRLKQAA